MMHVIIPCIIPENGDNPEKESVMIHVIYITGTYIPYIIPDNSGDNPEESVMMHVIYTVHYPR